MFNISKLIGTILHVRYYTTISLAMRLHFNVKSLAAIFGGKLFGGSVLPAQYCPCGKHTEAMIKLLVNLGGKEPIKYKLQ